MLFRNLKINFQIYREFSLSLHFRFPAFKVLRKNLTNSPHLGKYLRS